MNQTTEKKEAKVTSKTTSDANQRKINMLTKMKKILNRSKERLLKK